MAFYNNRSFLLERNIKRGEQRPLGPVGQRLMGALRRSDNDDEAEATPRRFPLVRRGYDRIAVDEYVSELEVELAGLDRELADLRGGAAAAQEVENELQRIGQQTSAVLLAAYEQRDEVLRQARAEAERCVSEAKATANSLTTQCEQRLRELRGQIDTARSERGRLLEEFRTISSALAAIADSAQERVAAQA